MALETQRFAHPKCYARELGGCSRTLSREHYISESVLEQVSNGFGTRSKSALTRGLSFLKPGEQKMLGIASLTAKILCKTHNSLLSGYDNTAKALFGAVDRMNERAGKPGWPEETVHIDGDAFERWMLKTLCGGLFSGAFRVMDREIEKGDVPPLEALRVLFEGEEFAEGAGLYYLQREVVTADQTVLATDTITERGGDQVRGLLIGFFGFKFAMSLGPMLPGEGEFRAPEFRPAGMRTHGSPTRIVFQWKGGPWSGELMFRLAG